MIYSELRSSRIERVSRKLQYTPFLPYTRRKPVAELPCGPNPPPFAFTSETPPRKSPTAGFFFNRSLYDSFLLTSNLFKPLPLEGSPFSPCARPPENIVGVTANSKGGFVF